MIVLRDYQTALIDQCRHAMRDGAKRILITSPTGSGKTALTAHMLARAAARGRRAWFCVHRKELLDQSVTTFIEAADIHTGIVAAGYPSTPLAPVHVCSVPSLARRAAGLASPDLLVWDECHHLASKSWSSIAATFPHAVHIGLTATPQRLDGRGLGPYFDVLLQGPTTAQLIAQGYLSPYRLYSPPPTAPLHLDALHTVAGDYNRKETTDAMDSSTVMGDAVSHYLAHCPGARALVFAWSIESSQRLAAQFTTAQVPAAHVDGETPRAVRAEAMRRFRDGQLAVLCNVDLFGEGLDVPAVDAVFLLRPTQSLGLYLQQIGRGLRASDGKTHVTIFDHVNNCERHGLPDDERVWSLDGRKAKDREAALVVKRCPACFGVTRPSARVCPFCGASFPAQPREVAQVEGVLAEADLEALRAKRANARDAYPQCQTLADWQRLAKELGYKSGWAWTMHNLRHSQKRQAPKLFTSVSQ